MAKISQFEVCLLNIRPFLLMAGSSLVEKLKLMVVRLLNKTGFPR